MDDSREGNAEKATITQHLLDPSLNNFIPQTEQTKLKVPNAIFLECLKTKLNHRVSELLTINTIEKHRKKKQT